jgi:hypothetical protein
LLVIAMQRDFVEPGGFGSALGNDVAPLRRIIPTIAGITNYLENDGTLEVAQRIAGHADSRTTKLYDRRGQKVLLEDMERIRY